MWKSQFRKLGTSLLTSLVSRAGESSDQITMAAPTMTSPSNESKDMSVILRPFFISLYGCLVNV